MKYIKGLFCTHFEYDALPFIIDDYFVKHTFDPFKVANGTLLDIGAHVGIFSLWAAPWAKKIYALEPAKEHYDNLVKNIEYNEMTDIVVPIKKAVSNVNGKTTLYHNNNRTMFNLTKGIAGDTGEKEEVDVITLDKLFDEYKIDHVDLMKLDVEGEEFKILAGKEFDKVMPKIDSMMVEFHAWSGVSLSQCYAMLKDRGYKLSKLEGDAFNIYATKL